MATISRFEDAIVWKKAVELGTLVYRQTGPLHDLAFLDQIRRAVLSISNNIAEGFERRSVKEKTQFFTIARGSASEVRSMVIFGEKIGHFSAGSAKQMDALALEIIKMLSSLMIRMEK